MKQLIIVLALFSMALVGCERAEESVELPVRSEKADVNVGDSYADVLDKLGKPNINSVTENSRVLIYDRIEVKLESDVVVEVFDHRG